MTTKVLRVIARMNVGGPAIHAFLLVRGLDPARYESRLVTGSTGSTEGSYLDLHGLTLAGVTEVPNLGREIHLWRDITAFRQLVRIMREFRPDIVHTHTAKAGLLGRLAAWWCGVPVILHTFHGHVFKGYFSRTKEAMFVLAERLLAGVTTRLVAVNATVRDEVLARGVGRADQFAVVPLGFDLSPFEACDGQRGRLRADLGVGPSVPLVGIVARLVPIKAHEIFLAMAAKVLRRHPTTRFAIVGDGERRQELEVMVRELGITGSVHFMGWRTDLAAVYADLDVVVLTSRNEGSPVTLIEAMASGRPVVATRAGGVVELVGDCGLLTDIDDVDALAQSVDRLLDDPAFARALGRRAQARILPAFGSARLVADIDSLYSELMMVRA